jgi:hypothetical protein
MAEGEGRIGGKGTAGDSDSQAHRTFQEARYYSIAQ